MTTEAQNNTIELLTHHLPALGSGTYTLSVTQTVAIEKPVAETHVFKATHRIAVVGPRFTLDPQSIGEVFPPPSSLGDHSRSLPHIVLQRSTLPWERSPDHANLTPAPWLALLLFDESEAAEVQVKGVTRADLRRSGAFPELQAEQLGEHDDDPLTIIAVSPALLQALMPTRHTLSQLAHVRRVTHADHTQEEVAVLVSNRLPQPGRKSTAHLVSVEGRYADGVFQPPSVNGWVWLVSLKSWSFSCVSDDHDFKGLLHHLDRGREVFGALRLPQGRAGAAAERYLSIGAIPLRHTPRAGTPTFSWYHGPLAPGENKTEPGASRLPAYAAGDLLRTDPNHGMVDVSYAAAWELGRLLILQDRNVALALLGWKRGHAQLSRAAADMQLADLPFAPTNPDMELPPALGSWFKRLALLEGVPFHYLVPDEAMLPNESIRFFQLDWLWLECLIDGAFSIGRVLRADAARDRAHHEVGTAQQRTHAASGFLLRSEVVSGWPGLQVEGFVGTQESETPNSASRLEVLRLERLSPNVLLCIFAGIVGTLDIFLRTGTLHFELEAASERPAGKGILAVPEDKTSVAFIEPLITVMPRVRFRHNSL